MAHLRDIYSLNMDWYMDILYLPINLCCVDVLHHLMCQYFWKSYIWGIKIKNGVR